MSESFLKCYLNVYIQSNKLSLSVAKTSTSSGPNLTVRVALKGNVAAHAAMSWSD